MWDEVVFRFNEEMSVIVDHDNMLIFIDHNNIQYRHRQLKKTYTMSKTLKETCDFALKNTMGRIHKC